MRSVKIEVRLLAILILCLVPLWPCSAQNPKTRKPKVKVPPVQEQTYATTLLQNQDVSIRRLNIPPQSAAPVAATTHDYLIISIGTNSITVKGGPSSFDLALRPGDMQVIDGGWQHALLNTAITEAELFAIEPFRNINPKSAICGLGAKRCSDHHFGETAQGTYYEFEQFETETVKLLRLTVGAGVVTHLHDDNRKHLIIALTSFRGHNDSEKFDLKPGDMRWISGGFQEFGNDGTNEARALILELK